MGNTLLENLLFLIIVCCVQLLITLGNNRLIWVDIDGKSIQYVDVFDGQSELTSISTQKRPCCIGLTMKQSEYLVGFEDGFCIVDTDKPIYEQDLSVFDVFEPGSEKTRVNDGRADTFGRFLTAGYNQNHSKDLDHACGVYVTCPSDKKLRRLDSQVIPNVRGGNGLALSPSGKTLYYTDTPYKIIYACDYSPEGEVSNRRAIFNFPENLPGRPDGATTDATGGLWIALYDGGGAIRIANSQPENQDEQWEITHFVQTPDARLVTCPVLGGQKLQTLYLTTSNKSGEENAGEIFSFDLPSELKGWDTPITQF